MAEFGFSIVITDMKSKRYRHAFYALRGYIPDGAGVYYEERVLPKDEDCRNDDELTICLVKEFER